MIKSPQSKSEKAARERNVIDPWEMDDSVGKQDYGVRVETSLRLAES